MGKDILIGLAILAVFAAALVLSTAEPTKAQGGLGPGCNECINDTYELVYNSQLYTYGTASDEDVPPLGAWLELDIQSVNDLIGVGILTWKVDRIIERRDNTNADPTIVSRRIQLLPQT